MKIYVANYQPERIGGGWSFVRNFVRGMGDLITQDYDQSDIYFIASPSMVLRPDVEKAFDDGKKIILRVDNAVRNSRNRNTGMSRMFDFAQMSDLIVFQSQWAKDYLLPFLESGPRKYKNSQVIHNGVDIDRFINSEKNNNILYSRFNRDETKNWEVARYWFSTERANYPDSKLIITGNFSEELRNGNFDFYNNEPYDYLGVLDEKNMAKLLSVTGNFLYTYYNDACSNSLIEALCAGCNIVGDEYYRQTGGAPEILTAYKEYGRKYFSIDRMVGEYKEAISKA